MTAYRIFQQALRELFANFSAVLRISGPLFLIGVVLAIVVRALMVAAMARAEAVNLVQGAAGMCLIAYILLATIWGRSAGIGSSCWERRRAGFFRAGMRNGCWPISGGWW